MTADVSVQFTYTVTLREIADGLKLQLRHSPVGRWGYRVLRVVGIFLALVIAINVAAKGIDSPALGLLQFTVTVIVIMIACRWLMALGLLGYARHLGEHRVTVDQSGIGTVSERHTNHTGWEFYGRCIEGRRVFVLLTPDVWGAGVLILPKRGLSAPQDTERMRELLAAALIDSTQTARVRRR
ncbi:YcxB family protein [Streptomyces sp. NBC_01142]|uniref:YcxB family protein n=1 Tax=Streptomyces sp. NBC_01142 TaxID=2975865 RepID=UPI00224DDBAB|nr:YcxB family protein [Streptomyces sp. NBC_01142]MCX4824616.1 YcxB family protein [Streptomyces sp. NBC_01142]